MKVILFGASGMVGQGVLRECLRDPGVEAVLVVGRSPLGQQDPRLHELIHADFADFTTVATTLAGYDACFFCLGVSAAGMKEADYRHVTFDFTLAAARVLAAQNPGMTFVYVSGRSTDSTEQGRAMWARVKGATENALLKLPFKAAYMFRPGLIRPLHGIKSKTRVYRMFYTALGPLLPALQKVFPSGIITTELVGRAMLAVARNGAPARLLENEDIARLAREETRL